MLVPPFWRAGHGFQNSQKALVSKNCIRIADWAPYDVGPSSEISLIYHVQGSSNSWWYRSLVVGRKMFLGYSRSIHMLPFTSDWLAVFAWFLESFPDAVYCNLMFLLRWSMWFPSCGLGAESQSLPSSYGLCNCAGSEVLGMGIIVVFSFKRKIGCVVCSWSGWVIPGRMVKPFQFTFAEYCVYIYIFVYLFYIHNMLRCIYNFNPTTWFGSLPSFLEFPFTICLRWKFPNRWCCPDMKNAKGHTSCRINHVFPGWRKLTHFDLW